MNLLFQDQLEHARRRLISLTKLLEHQSRFSSSLSDHLMFLFDLMIKRAYAEEYSGHQDKQLKHSAH